MSTSIVRRAKALRSARSEFCPATTTRARAQPRSVRARRERVRSVRRKGSALTQARSGLLPAPEPVNRMNRVMLGWAKSSVWRGRVRPIEQSKRDGTGCASGCVGTTMCRPGGTCASRKRGRGQTTTQHTRVCGPAAAHYRRHYLEGEPSARNSHARFDARGEETWSPWLRHRH